MAARTQHSRRYAKLAWIGLAGTLALASPARAELVADQASSAVLAVGPGPRPYVTYIKGCGLYVARRSSGGWRNQRLGCLAPEPMGSFTVAGLVVDRRGLASVLVWSYRRVVLFRQTAKAWKASTVAAGGRYGAPGLTLDSRGLPAIGYALWRPPTDSYLRIATVDRDGRLLRRAVTQNGFPATLAPPAAAPVLVGRRLHVVEAYGGSAIDWGPSGKTWEGQFLFATRAGGIVGAVGAAFAGGLLHAAFSVDAPELGEVNVVHLTSSATQRSAVLFRHARFAALTVPGTGPEVAANDFVQLNDGLVSAGLIAAPGLNVELDGRIEGYAALAGGSRYVLLNHSPGLELFAFPALRPVSIELQAQSEPDGTVSVTGEIPGQSTAEVLLYREAADGRTVVSSTPLSADGTFSFVDPAPVPETAYRAVYREPSTGLPYAALLRTSCCASLRR